MITLISSFRNEEKNIATFSRVVTKTILFLRTKKIFIKEIILVDNGSSDNTFKILKKLNFKNIKVIIIKNIAPNDNYGDGFGRAFKLSNEKFVVTMHSDMQFDIFDFFKKNINEIQECLNNNFSLFPKRSNRSFKNYIKTFVLKIILLILFGRYFDDFNGHPKIIFKKHFKKVIRLPSGFSWDCFMYFWLIHNNKPINTKCIVHEKKRVFGVSSWGKDFKQQILLLYDFILELRKIIKTNNKKFKL